MALYIDCNVTSCFDVEQHNAKFPCQAHIKETIAEDNGEVWTICSNCKRILNFQNIKEPIYKKKKMVIRG